MRVYNIRIYIASIIEILYGINIKVYTRVYNVEIVKVFTVNVGRLNYPGVQIIYVFGIKKSI